MGRNSSGLVNPIIIELFILQQEMKQFDKHSEEYGEIESWEENLVETMIIVAENFGKTREKAVQLLGETEMDKQLKLFENLGDLKNDN